MAWVMQSALAVLEQPHMLICHAFLSQRNGIDPNILTPITVPVPEFEVSMIVIETVKPQNCSIIQGIAIDQCCEPGNFQFLSKVT